MAQSPRSSDDGSRAEPAKQVDAGPAQTSNRWMLWLSGLLSVAILAASVGFYHWHFTGRKLYLKERNQRMIATAAGRLEGSTRSRLPAQVKLDPGGSFLTVTLLEAGPSRDRPDFRVGLRGALEAVPRPGSFDGLFVAKETGEVLVHHRSSLHGLNSVLVTSWDASSEFDPDAAIARGPTYRQLRLHGGSVLAFCHPAKLMSKPDISRHEAANARANGNARSEDMTLVLCGLVAEDRLRREARQFSPLSVALALAVVALTLLGWPFVKFTMMTRHERLRLIHAWALVGCAFLSLMIVTIAVFAIAAYHGLKGLADGELQALAQDVPASLKEEVNAIKSQMTDFEEYVGNPRTHPQPEGSRAALDAWVFNADAKDDGCATLSDRNRLLHNRRNRPPPAHAYSSYESVAWISREGLQCLKLYNPPTGGQGTGPARAFFPVRERTYFNEAREGRGSRGNGWPQGLYLIDSWSSGEVRAVVSRPLDAPTGGVQALTTRLVSLRDPVLPSGVGYAVVDDSGDVWFHSRSREVHTDFFAETKHGPYIRSVVANRAKATLTTDYWGQSVRLRLDPLPGSSKPSLTLATFRDSESLRAVIVGGLWLALPQCLVFWVGAFALPTLAWFLAACGRTPGYRCAPFPWPDSKAAGFYLQLAVALTSLGAMYLWGLHRLDEPYFQFTLALGPAVILVLAVCGLGRAYVAHRRRRVVPLAAAGGSIALLLAVALLPEGPAWLLAGGGLSALLAYALVESWGAPARAFRACHRAAWTSFWLVVAILPAFGLAKGSIERALVAGASAAQHTYLAELERRSNDSLGVYPMVGAHAHLEAASLEGNGTLHDAVRAQPTRPVVTPSGVRRPLGPGTAPREGASQAASDWLSNLLITWSPTHVARAPNAPVGKPWVRASTSRPELAVEAAAPSFWQVAGGQPWVVVVILVVLVWFALVVRAERELLATDVSSPRRSDTRSLETHPPPGPTFFLVPSALEEHDLHEGGWYARWSRSRRKPHGPAPARAADLLSGPEAKRKKTLRELGRLVQQGRRVEVVTTRTPTQLLDSITGVDAAERADWIALFARFDVVYVAPDVGREAHRWLHAMDRTAAAEILREEIGAAPAVGDLCESHDANDVELRDKRACPRRLEQIARGYYTSLWESCTPDERLTLVQAAEEGLVNPKRLDVVEGLLGKGLLRREFGLVPMNRSFALFLARPEVRDSVLGRETRPANSAWTHLRIPLATLGVVAVAFLYETERALYDSTSIWVGALAAAVPLLAGLGKLTGSKLIAHLSGNGSAHA